MHIHHWIDLWSTTSDRVIHFRRDFYFLHGVWILLQPLIQGFVGHFPELTQAICWLAVTHLKIVVWRFICWLLLMRQLDLFCLQHCIFLQSNMLVLSLALLTFKIWSKHLIDKTTRMSLLLSRWDLRGRFVNIRIFLLVVIIVAYV